MLTTDEDRMLRGGWTEIVEVCTIAAELSPIGLSLHQYCYILPVVAPCVHSKFSNAAASAEWLFVRSL